MAKIKVVEKDINDLKVYEGNPRQNEKAVETVKESIKEFGKLDMELQEITEKDWERFGFKKKDLDILEPPENCTCPK